jgi:hypothetical protein
MHVGCRSGSWCRSSTASGDDSRRRHAIEARSITPKEPGSRDYTSLETSPRTGAAFPPDGNTIAIHGGLAVAEVWNLQSRKRIAQVAFEEALEEIGFSEDRRFLIGMGRTSASRLLWRNEDLKRESCTPYPEPQPGGGECGGSFGAVGSRTCANRR